MQTELTTTLLERLYSTNPYEGFDHENYNLDLHGWGSDHPVFRKVIEEVSPKLIVEVGTWKGASAVHMAQCLEDLGMDATIVCVDTWLGAVEFWEDKQDPERYLSLKLKHGYPTVFYQFLANVVKSGFHDVIVPFPQTSTIAARWLRKNDIQPDLIYVDGSHEEEDVLQDLIDYWQVVAPGGMLFGDDFDEYWPGVRSAVRRFAQLCEIKEDIHDRKWMLRKPKDWVDREPVHENSRATRIATATQFEVISEQLAQMIREIRARDQELHAKNQELASLRDELRSAEDKLQRYTAWIENVQESLTWRMLARHTIGRNPAPPTSRNGQAES